MWRVVAFDVFVLLKLQWGSFEHGPVSLLGNELFDIMMADSSLAIGEQSFNSSAL
jgi:hypothetical protein